jgi:hypothetical protein
MISKRVVDEEEVEEEEVVWRKKFDVGCRERALLMRCC